MIWGGSELSTQDTHVPVRGGAIYSPSSNQWSPIENGPLAARENAAFVSLGDAVFVWGGQNGGELSDGALYDLAAQ